VVEAIEIRPYHRLELKNDDLAWLIAAKSLIADFRKVLS